MSRDFARQHLPLDPRRIAPLTLVQGLKEVAWAVLPHAVAVAVGLGLGLAVWRWML